MAATQIDINQITFSSATVAGIIGALVGVIILLVLRNYFDSIRAVQDAVKANGDAIAGSKELADKNFVEAFQRIDNLERHHDRCKYCREAEK